MSEMTKDIMELIAEQIMYWKNHERASWGQMALEEYTSITSKHIHLVKAFGRYLETVFDSEVERLQFIESIQHHDEDKLNGDPEFRANYAANTLCFYKLKEDYAVTEQSAKDFDDKYWKQHWSVSMHHPEYWAKGKVNFAGQYVATSMPKPYLAEMVADWCAVGLFAKNSARVWWEHNKDVRWFFTEEQKAFIERCIETTEALGAAPTFNPITHQGTLKEALHDTSGTPVTSSESMLVDTASVAKVWVEATTGDKKLGYFQVEKWTPGTDVLGLQVFPTLKAVREQLERSSYVSPDVKYIVGIPKSLIPKGALVSEDGCLYIRPSKTIKFEWKDFTVVELEDKKSNEAITANTPDEKRGKISKAHQDLCGKYLYHGTHRDLDIKSLGIHVCKNRANTDIKAPCVYMNRTIALACLHCVPFMVGHGSKLPNYKEHFVDLNKAINSDDKFLNVEIVHNDPKLEECSGSSDGYIYCVKKEDCVDDLYYATPEKPNDWNFVAYKQLPIDKKIHVKVNWHKKYDEAFAKKVKSGYAAVESMQVSYEAVQEKSWTKSDITCVNDLKKFYKQCTYGLIDFKADKPWKETHKNTTFEDWEKEWRLLSVDELLKYKCGICYDTAKANDYFLTKWKIDHINLFAYTKRSLNDSYDDDPTHTFTIYKDSDSKWKWLEGSWWSFKNNNWESSSADTLIKNITKALANDYGVACLVGVITSWPSDGVNMDTFYRTVKESAHKHPKYEIEPDKSYSKESLDPKFADKRKKIIALVVKIMDLCDPSKINSKRWSELLSKMTDKQFDEFMQALKAGKTQMHIVAPNLEMSLQNKDLLAAADALGLEIFHRIWFKDSVTGKRYLSDNRYMVLQLPIRRQQQFLDEKISVPDNDKTIDGLTGQVTGDSRACSVTNPEIQILAARGLDNVLEEFVRVRGGDMHAYSEFKRQLEETGEADLSSLGKFSRSRVSVMAGVLLKAMMLDTNI